MAVTRTIGKNTLGDNEKMRVHLHDYEMSSHNLSYVFRSTVGVGMLVPFMKIVAQKGDVFDIQLTNKTMTHPTKGPLFGAFKLQHFVFTAGFRLYNSWLHNNRTGIGMKMSDIKLPIMSSYSFGTSGESKTQFNPSSLYSYLGWKGARKKDPGICSKQAVPLLIYLDIFKNYFANTQEENFYMIGQGSRKEVVTINAQMNSINHQLILNQEGISNMGSNITNTLYLTAADGVTDFNKFWNSILLDFVEVSGSQNIHHPYNVSSLTSFLNAKEIAIQPEDMPTEVQASNGIAGFKIISGKESDFNASFGMGIIPNKLELLDSVRDQILAQPGNDAYVLNYDGSEITKNFFKSISNVQNVKLGGLLLKTYDSDIFNNWVKTDWIDGDNGISKITALKPDADGNITMDALNLQEKVYNMLNRIAVSGGTYRDWLETVYTAGRYLDRPETPVFQGGMSQIIEFDEVVATTGNPSDNQALGDLAGRGYARRPNGSGHLHFQVEEPGYVFGILAITPMVDYSQGNDFDLNLLTMDDLHKPALDGIGYQDSMNEQRAWWTALNENSSNGGIVTQDTTPGKTVAWIDYMTNFNRTFGNFAAGENEDFMVLNRNFEQGENNTIANISTYINPQEHIDIFADTALDSQNFWIQTACEITKRGNYSAKQIPNL